VGEEEWRGGKRGSTSGSPFLSSPLLPFPPSFPSFLLLPPPSFPTFRTFCYLSPYILLLSFKDLTVIRLTLGKRNMSQESSSPPAAAVASSSPSQPTAKALGEELNEAVRRGDQGKVKQLLSSGADVNFKDPSYGWTPLHNAAREGHFEIFKLLLSKGADPNGKDAMGQTPLHRYVPSRFVFRQSGGFSVPTVRCLAGPPRGATRSWLTTSSSWGVILWPRTTWSRRQRTSPGTRSTTMCTWWS